MRVTSWVCGEVECSTVNAVRTFCVEAGMRVVAALRDHSVDPLASSRTTPENRAPR